MKGRWVPPIDSQSSNLEKQEIGVGSKVHTCGQEGHLIGSLLSPGEVLSFEKVLSRIRLHAQNLTWVNDSDSSFYSISGLDSSIEIDPADGLLDRLERGEVSVPGDLGSRGSQRPSLVILGTLSRQWSTHLQPRLARRSDWWSASSGPSLRVPVWQAEIHSLGNSCVRGNRTASHSQGCPQCRRPRSWSRGWQNSWSQSNRATSSRGHRSGPHYRRICQASVRGPSVSTASQQTRTLPVWIRNQSYLSTTTPTCLGRGRPSGHQSNRRTTSLQTPPH